VTQMLQPPPPSTSTGPTTSSRQPTFRRRGRAAVVGALVVSLLASAGTRLLSDSSREKNIPHGGEAAAGTSLSSMNSFALGLLLGGLRGPLVMFLWTQSESQKTDKNLEGVDSQIEWIRLLQPEFDTVHIFQIWNKAYNISVQMASLANKYSVILDALDYAHSVDRAKPDDINILTAMAQIYFDKLGNSTEKLYYRRRVRTESLPHPTSSRHANDPGWRRTSMDPLLGTDFRLLPQLIAPAPGRQRPANLAPTAEYDDGSELQYLAAWQPFLDGVPPYALAYNYYKRSEVLQNVYMQRHAQLSDSVIDSRPGLSLENWGQEDWEQGRRREAQAFGLPVPEERSDLETLTANFSPRQPIVDRHAADLAIFDYQRAADLVPAAVKEYFRHIANDPGALDVYRSHLMEMLGWSDLCQADRDYLAATLADPGKRAPLLASARQHYLAAMYHYQVLVLAFYTDLEYLGKALPPEAMKNRAGFESTIEHLTPAQAAEVSNRVYQLRGKRPDSHQDDLQTFNDYFARIGLRLRHLP
jgi:hypothetical protein